MAKGDSYGVLVLYNGAATEWAQAFVAQSRGKTILNRSVHAEMCDPGGNDVTYGSRVDSLIRGIDVNDEEQIQDHQLKDDSVCEAAVALWGNHDRTPLKDNLALEVGTWLGYRGDHDLVVLSIDGGRPPDDFGKIAFHAVRNKERVFQAFQREIENRKKRQRIT